MDPGSILQTLLSNFAKLLPFRWMTVYSYQTGVKFRFGKDIHRVSHRTGIRIPKLCWRGRGIPSICWTRRTGLHFYWAGAEDIFVLNKVEKVMETQFQTVLTSDGKELTMSMSVSYRIPNARKYWTNVEDFAYSLENLCQSYLTNEINSLQYKEVIQSPEHMTEEMRHALNQKVRDWGTYVVSIALVNNSKARAFRLFGHE